MDLLVVLGIHEIVIAPVLVEIFHLPLVQNRALDAIFRPETVVDNRSRAQLPQLGLDHSTPVSRRNMLIIDHLVKLAIEQYGVSPAQLCCLNHYREAPV